jgi:hypothetical protein
MLAVTTGDGACVEKNSTQPTARVSILTANGMVRPCSGLASKRSLQGASKTASTRCHRNSGGPWPKTGQRVQGHSIYKTPVTGLVPSSHSLVFLRFASA